MPRTNRPRWSWRAGLGLTADGASCRRGRIRRLREGRAGTDRTGSSRANRDRPKRSRRSGQRQAAVAAARTNRRSRAGRTIVPRTSRSLLSAALVQGRPGRRLGRLVPGNGGHRGCCWQSEEESLPRPAGLPREAGQGPCRSFLGWASRPSTRSICCEPAAGCCWWEPGRRGAVAHQRAG